MQLFFVKIKIIFHFMINFQISNKIPYFNAETNILRTLDITQNDTSK